MNPSDVKLFTRRSEEEMELINLRDLAISLKHKLIEFGEEEFFEDRKAAHKLITKINRKLRENK